MVSLVIMRTGSPLVEGQGHSFAQKIYQRQSEIFEAPVCGMSDGPIICLQISEAATQKALLKLKTAKNIKVVQLSTTVLD